MAQGALRELIEMSLPGVLVRCTTAHCHRANESSGEERVVVFHSHSYFPSALDWLGHFTFSTRGGIQVPAPGGRIDGASVFGQ